MGKGLLIIVADIVMVWDSVCWMKRITVVPFWDAGDLFINVHEIPFLASDHMFSV